eukprot:TRINITY_DN2241_c0_g1_i1.p1 TRINITY_DN2241_c0_g1~~TRINITY_DN2241_c0_g1_i1.p1  ORF type:complete len:110 (+),score=28.47 TRINITY_DN2241_c0_g1_i1:56-385(+)
MADHEEFIAKLRTFQKARKEHDEATFMSLLSEDAEFTNPRGTSFKGTEQIRAWFNEKNDLPEWEDHWTHIEGHHFQRKGTMKKFLMTFNLIQDVWFENGKLVKAVARQA